MRSRVQVLWLLAQAAYALAQSGVTLTVTNIPGSATRLVVVADGAAVTGSVYTRWNLASGTSSITLNMGLPAGEYRLRALADDGSRVLLRTGQAPVTVPPAGTAATTVALAEITSSLDPATPQAAGPGSSVALRFRIADPGDVLETAAAHLYTSTAPFVALGGGTNAGGCGISKTAPGQYAAACAINLPPAGAALYYALRVEVPVEDGYSVLYSPSPPGSPWRIDITAGPGLSLTVEDLPAAATRVVVIADGASIRGAIYTHQDVAAGNTSATLSLGLPPGACRLRVLADGPDRRLLRTGQVAAVVPTAGTTAVSLALSDVSVTVSAATPGAATSGSTLALRFDIADPGDVVEGMYAQLYIDSEPFATLTGGTYGGAALVAQRAPGAYTATPSANLPTTGTDLYYAVRVRVVTGDDDSFLCLPASAHLSLNRASGVALAVSGLPAAATRLVVIANGPALSGNSYTRRAVDPAGGALTLELGLPPGPYRLRALADGPDRGLLRTAQTTVTVPASGMATAALALSDVTAILDPTSPVSAVPGSTARFRFNLTDPGDVLEGTYPQLYTGTAPFDLLEGGTYAGAAPAMRLATGVYAVTLSVNLPTSGSVLYHALRAPVATGVDYAVLYAPAPRATAPSPWLVALGAPCSYELAPGSLAAPPAAVNGAIVVKASATVCPWNAQATAPWIEITTSQPAGSGTLAFALQANRTGAPRSAGILLGGHTIPVTQQAPQPLRLVPVTPCRVADTRWTVGPFGGPTLSGGETRTFTLPEGKCGLPAGALAYALNVSVVPRPTLGFLALWPAGESQPVVSTLNSFDGRVKANAALAPAGLNGGVSVIVSDRSDVLLDVTGYFVPAANAPPEALAFYPVAPCRAMDTRWSPGPFGAPRLAAGQARTVPLAASGCGLPAAARAYSLNFTVIPRTPQFSFLSAWPAGQAMPVASTLNAFTGAVTANAALVPAGANGAINVYGTDAADLVVDVNGYFAPPGLGGLSFYAATPCRVVDTRAGPAPFGAPTLAGSRDLPLPAGACGLPASSAYSLNATVIPRPKLDFLSLWPTGGKQPAVSTLNSFDGSVASNAVLVPANSAGSITAYHTQTADLILDVNGYFAP